jgi:flagellin-like hook-associated protein FlgL
MQTKGKANTQKVKQNLVGAGFAETRDVELQRQLVSSGMAIDEFKVINKKITDGIIKGFDALGDKTEITSEELNNLLRKAYEEVAKTDTRVEKAYNNMKQISTTFSPDRAGVRGLRIPITEDSYVKQKKSTPRTPSQFRKMQSQMVGAENIPYPQSSRFVVTHNVAKELGITSNQAAEIYNKMSVDAKTTLSRMRNDLKAFKQEFIIEAAKVGQSGVRATADSNGLITLTVDAKDGRGIEITGASLAGTGLTDQASSTTAKITLSTNGDKGIVIGGDAGATSTGQVANKGFNASVLSSSGGVDLSTAAGSQAALSVLDKAINTVTDSRASMGAYQNRLTASVANLEVTSMNLQASRSRILDTDYAKETTNLAKSQIIQQAATAMLAQANQSAQSVLALLK